MEDCPEGTHKKGVGQTARNMADNKALVEEVLTAVQLQGQR